MQNNTFSIAVLGAGNIGSAVLTRLQELDDKVLKLDLKKTFNSNVSSEQYTLTGYSTRHILSR